MTLKDVISVLNFAAFRPEPDDPSASWRRRFPNHRTVLTGVGKSSLGWRGVLKSGRFTEGGLIRGDLKDLINQASIQIKDLADDGWCAVSLNTRYVISLETNLSRRPGSEDVIKTTPRNVLGARYERGKRYSVTHNPETNASILLSTDEDYIKKLEGMLKEAGLNVGRVCCGSYVLLRHALAATNLTRSGEKTATCFYIVCCMGAVCALVQDQDRWLELRSRTDVYEDTLDPVIDLVTPFKQRVAPESEIVLICDQPYEGLTEALQELFAGHKITDLSQPDLLWSLIAQY